RGGAGLHRTADRARAPGPRRDRGTAGDAAMSTAGPLTAHRPERVAVVIPAKNEAERIEATILSARRIPGVDLVVVVDDGSTDASRRSRRAAQVQPRPGRGDGHRRAAGRDPRGRGTGRRRRELLRGAARRAARARAHRPAARDRPGEAVPRALLFLDADMGDS